ncbi:MAG: uncharacterized protein JWR69_1092 [Pedosphaera sp.]|nr:uncharacterized protein [Pedosphaera sp.]
MFTAPALSRCRQLRFLHTALSLVLLCACPDQDAAAQSNSTEVVVDVRNAYRINGHDQVQSNDFGVTAYQGATRPVTPTGAAIIKQAGLTVLGFPGNIAWCAPAKKPADGAEGIARWYASDEAKQMIRDRPLNGDRYEYGRILPACRQNGVEPMVYLLGGPDWILGPEGIPNDDNLYTALIVGYVGLLRQFDPHLRLFHLDNEPNAHWWKANKSGQDYGRLFNVVAKALHAKYPDLLLGGPVLLWPPAFPPNQPGQPNWYTWPQWTIPFLDTALDQSDFFDFHHYDSESRENRREYIESALEEVNLISNEMSRRGKLKPVAITECGLALTEEDWQDPAKHYRRRTYPWAHFLISLLERPDKVMTVQMHDLSAVAGQWYKFLADDPDGFSMSETIDPKKLQTQPPTYWLYWLFRHTRGTRLVATAGNALNLTLFATRQHLRDGDEAAVFMVNDRDTPRPNNVIFLGAPASAVVRWERLYLSTSTNEVVHESGTGTIPAMPPRSLLVAWVAVPAETPLHPVQERSELLGETVLQEFPEPGSPGADRPDATVTIPVVIPPAALLGATSVGVSVGTQGNASQDKLTMVFDGQSYPLKGGVYFQEVPLRSLPTAGQHEVRFNLNHREGSHRLRISCITLKIERQLNDK